MNERKIIKKKGNKTSTKLNASSCNVRSQIRKEYLENNDL